MAYDPTLQSIVLYGGAVGNLPAGSGSAWSYSYDTWEFSGGAWQNVTGSVGVSPGLGDATLVYDPPQGGVLLLGGSDPGAGCAPLVESWVFAEGRWSNVSGAPTSGPGGSQGLSGYGTAYDDYLGGVVTVGGNTANGRGGCYSVDSTWEYTPAGWTNITSAVGTVAPVGRASFQLAYDPPGEFALVFGGNIDNSLAYLGDTWALTSNASVFAPPSSAGSSGGSGLGFGWADLSVPVILIAVGTFVVGLAVGILLARQRPPPPERPPYVVRAPPVP
jgi:hypothetical protein